MHDTPWRKKPAQCRDWTSILYLRMPGTSKPLCAGERSRERGDLRFKILLVQPEESPPSNPRTLDEYCNILRNQRGQTNRLNLSRLIRGCHLQSCSQVCSELRWCPHLGILRKVVNRRRGGQSRAWKWDDRESLRASGTPWGLRQFICTHISSATAASIPTVLGMVELRRNRERTWCLTARRFRYRSQRLGRAAALARVQTIVSWGRRNVVMVSSVDIVPGGVRAREDASRSGLDRVRVRIRLQDRIFLSR